MQVGARPNGFMCSYRSCWSYGRMKCSPCHLIASVDISDSASHQYCAESQSVRGFGCDESLVHPRALGCVLIVKQQRTCISRLRDRPVCFSSNATNSPTFPVKPKSVVASVCFLFDLATTTDQVIFVTDLTFTPNMPRAVFHRAETSVLILEALWPRLNL